MLNHKSQLGGSTSRDVSDLMLKPKILTHEQLREFAKRLAYLHEAGSFDNRFYGSILSSLQSDEITLKRIYNVFLEALKKEKLTLPSSAEWLLDNYYIISEQIQTIKSSLTRGFYKDLIKLGNGPLKGYPRIYSLAIELLEHTDNRIETEGLVDIVLSYESVSPLTSAELWALPLMLRIVLVGNLKKLIQTAEKTFLKRKHANDWVDAFTDSKMIQVDDLSEIGSFFKNKTKIDSSYLIWLLRCFRDKDHVTNAVHWIEQYIEQEDINIEAVVKAENQKQAANRVSTGNAVSSLRLISSIDWSNFFESVSMVQRILEQDPDESYSRMDFNSRDKYRHVIENISRFCLYNEQEVARRSIKLARSGEGKAKHVGYYLIDKGLLELKRNVDYKPSIRLKILETLKQHPSFFYLLASLSLIFITSGIFSSFLNSHSISAIWSVIAIIPFSVPIFAIVNKLIVVYYPPDTPPKLEFKNGVPDMYKTMVVIPCLIDSSKEIKKLANILERRYLANKDKNIYFALLTDFPDTDEETIAEEEILLDELSKSVSQLNDKFKLDRKNIFYVFHRPRIYNEVEKIWMGWERKRGKLEEFNRLVVGDKETSFKCLVGDNKILKKIKYAITLDVDTQMPLHSAIKLIGTMAHPLNKPEIDPKTKCVISGYGIIQPRMGLHAPSAAKSLYTRVFATNAGLDPYHSVVSNLYQDFFGNSVYLGKGIYDIRVFYKCLNKRFPENRLLSHDLLEGNFIRVGLVTDIELLEDFPSGYASFSSRQHRWIRGDWQIGSWLFDRALKIQDKWKIIDNFRRSLVIPIGVLFLIWGWFTFPNDIFMWTAFSLCVVFYPLLEIFITTITSRLPGEGLQSFIQTSLTELKTLFIRAFVSISFMIHETNRNLNAIYLAIYRTTFKQKGALEWTTQAMFEKKGGKVLGMYSSEILGVGILILWIFHFQKFSSIPLLFSVLWIMAPVTAFLISRPEIKKILHLSDEERAELLVKARRIWRFFDEFAGKSNNHLPPDNFQVSPGPILANRTSPTNIGFGMLAAISAYDLDFVTKDELFQNLTNTLNTIDSLEKFKGHLYNWYRTDTLETMHPAYISTVDSGNFAASLIGLKQSCLEIAKKESKKLVDKRGWIASKTAWKEDWQHLSDIEKMQLPIASKSKIDTESLMRFISKAITGIEKIDLNQNLNENKIIFSEILELEIEAEKIVGQNKVKNIAYWRESLLKQQVVLHKKDTVSSDSWTLLSNRITKMILGIDFRFLYDQERKVFSIGYNAEKNKNDNSFYNLLATEARLASYVAISLGQIPEQHWFSLGRPLTKVKGKTVLLSWGGTMFEYLMPHLLMKDYNNTLLWQSTFSVIERQIKYARSKSIPWGMSESGFFGFDFQYNYQYQQFGIPDLSLKTEITNNLVVSPYSTLLALPVRPFEAFKNLKKLEMLGVSGTYGYYEAADFTHSRLPKNEKLGIVKSYMAHHQGVSIIALNNYFHNGLMQKRFHSEPMIIGSESLLNELIPVHIIKVEMPEEATIFSRNFRSPEPSMSSVTGKPDNVRTSILSNSEYSTVISNSGTGVSTWKNLDITRNVTDLSENNCGWFCFIKDLSSKEVWSATYQPFLKKPDKYIVNLLPYKAEFERVDDGLEVKTSIVVAVDKNVEIREITLTNRTLKTKRLEITDYAEVVGLPHREDYVHPAFGKLFVESEFDLDRQSLSFKRRSKIEGKNDLWIFHVVRGDGETITVKDYETDRNKFIGRGRTLQNAQAFTNSLSKTVGASLDPIMSLRTNVSLDYNESKTLYFITAVTEAKEHAENLIDQYLDQGEVERTFKLSEIHSQIELRHLGIDHKQAKLFQRLGSKIYFPDSYFRASKETLENNSENQSGLYSFGVSGDYPIVLIKIHNLEGLKLIKESLLAHEFLRIKRVNFDLIIINQESVAYSSELKDGIQNLIDTSLSRPLVDKPGGIFVREGSMLSFDDKTLFEASSSVILDTQWGSLEDNLELIPQRVKKQKTFELKRRISKQNKLEETTKNISFHFNKSENEFIVKQEEGQISPLPWSNVMANSHFGTLVTNGGLGYTWSENSQLNRISTWSNDPVTEKPGEILYFKDRKKWWSATPLPENIQNKFTVHHGWGYTKYDCENKEIFTETKVWVDENDPVKLILVTLKNLTETKRVIKPIFYTELVLGGNREKDQFFIVTKKDKATGAITARNSYNETFSKHITFVQSTQTTNFTADRKEFIGQGGSWSRPVYLEEKDGKLSGSVGAGLDPAIILEASVVLGAGEEKKIAFVIGQGENLQQYIELSQKYHSLYQIQESFDKSIPDLANQLTKIKINTPDKKLDSLTNGWLPYQILSGRFWGRSGFFQSSGAFGFRDQLQDALALIYQDPKLVRDHILYAASHQYIQGDVMHWWQPKTTHGVRTRISDDFLWLPYAVSKYLTITQDNEILNEKISFMDLAPLLEDEKEKYDEAVVTKEKSSLYIHCVRALENGMKTGMHGLPLMGTGDWNDGLGGVGKDGKGESVWLAWFQYDVYTSFSKIASSFGDSHNAIRYSSYAKQIRLATEKYGWDGEWYLRAFFDNGEPLGSQKNTQASIDSISQSWSVISGGASKERATQSLESVEKHLVKNDEKMILILTPPFNNAKPYPGYINGYLPGVRENGGQYTHAAVWVPLAYTKMGNGDRAIELLDMINPLSHTDNSKKLNTYKGEPYVLAGDVYSHPQHMGRVGWSWYTGSASWFYRVVIENVIGLNLSGEKLSFNPCIPKKWNEFNIIYRWQETEYNITVKNPSHQSTGVSQVILDKIKQKNKVIHLTNNGKSHTVEVIM